MSWDTEDPMAWANLSITSLVGAAILTQVTNGSITTTAVTGAFLLLGAAGIYGGMKADE